ncbi:MAG: hypothetical protein MJA27_14810 [Pseudanabaenales cyanobacterium]|nr:hypothetical protein [Pseudanabaenales cyanobacterium]
MGYTSTVWPYWMAMKDLDLESISVSEGLAKLADWLADLAGERLSEDSAAAYYALAAELERLASEAEDHQALMNN